MVEVFHSRANFSHTELTLSRPRFSKLQRDVTDWSRQCELGYN